MQGLVAEYKQSMQLLKVKLQELTDKVGKTDDDTEDMKLIRSMIRDLQWSIEWMETGRQPVNRRGVERLAVHKREKSIDPIQLQTYMYPSQPEEQVTSADADRIERALSTLTKLEREAYVMCKGGRISFSEIATMMGVAKGTVQKMVKRAERKVKHRRYLLHVG